MTARVTRLDEIRLPAFSRLSWATPGAQRLWGARLAQLAQGWSELVLDLAVSGAAVAVPVAAGADVSHKLRAAAARRGMQLVARPACDGVRLVAWRAPSPGRCGSARRQFLLGRHAAVEGVLAALSAGDAHGAQHRLGVPACCARFQRDGPAGWEQPWWPLAERTTPARSASLGSHRIELPAGSDRLPLWEALGIPALWYVPCSLDCAAAGTDQRRLLALIAGWGEDRALGWIEEIGRWPVSWSALHGIAEIKTPVFKLIQPTDATAEELCIHIAGSGPVAEAARGVRFPFVQRAQAGGGLARSASPEA